MRLLPLVLLLPQWWSSCTALRRQRSSPASKDVVDTEVNASLNASNAFEFMFKEGMAAAFRKFLKRREQEEVPFCTELRGRTLVYTCHNFRLGNAMMQYWNARAYAYFLGLDFESNSSRRDLVATLPKQVPLSSMEPPSALQKQLWTQMMAEKKDVCWTCPFPVGQPYGPWRLFGSTILEETRSAVQRTRKAGSPLLNKVTAWEHRQTTVVMHHRCDKTIWGNEQYGFIRHGFIKDHLPAGTTHMLLVGETSRTQPLCVKILDDLVEWLQKDLKLEVQHQETTVENDWLTLATAPVLFCSISTFCLTAGMGNPHTVYFPISGKNMVVVEEGADIALASQLRSPSFHWIRHDYVPGPAALDSQWEGLQSYFRSDHCLPLTHNCVDVGGTIPERYSFHNNVGMERADKVNKMHAKWKRQGKIFQ